jgi:peptidoglycan/LPS O-acetylase OafA/YrhL
LINSLRHVRSHTGLRGVAALLVVLYHLQFGAAYRLPLETFLPLGRGYLCVDLFFVLSGFIIAYSTRQGSSEAFTSTQTLMFWRARLARIYPLHLFCLGYLVLFWLLVTVARWTTGRPAPDVWAAERIYALLRQIVLLDPWNFGPPQSWNIPSWSVGAELCAYLLFPLLVLFVRVAPTLAQAALLVIGGAFYATVANSTGSLDITRGYAVWRCVAGFGLGVTIFINRSSFEKLSESALTIVQGLSSLLLLSAIFGHLQDVWAVPACALLIGATWQDRGIVAKALCIHPLQFLGRISYSIYLNHVCIIGICGYIWSRLEPQLGLNPGESRVSWLLIVIVLILFVSAATHRWIELPGKRLFGEKRRHPDSPWLLNRSTSGPAVPNEPNPTRQA